MALQITQIIRDMLHEGTLHCRQRWCWSWGDREFCEQLFKYIFRQMDRTFDEYQHLPEYDIVIDWMTNTNDKGLMLMGDCGRGKSIILSYVLPVLFRINNAVLMPVHAQDMGKLIPPPKDCHCAPNITYLEHLLTTPFPVIDELGVEPMMNNYGEKSEGFNQVLNVAERYHRPVFVSTNLSPEQIYERYGDRTMDRLTHLCRTIHFSGDSLRK